MHWNLGIREAADTAEQEDNHGVGGKRYFRREI